MTTEAKKKRKKPVSALGMALADLKKLGFHAAVVEKRIPHTFISKDMFGFADIVYLTSASIVALQVTTNTGGHHAKHKDKIIAEPRALAWLQAGGIVELWSYAKQGARGEAKVWVCRKESIVAEDFACSSPAK